MNDLEQISPQGAPLPMQQDKTLMDVEAARAVAQVQGSMAIAKRFPRNEAQAMSRLISAAQRRGLAEKAMYEYPKGGTQVVGPSIRAAEAISQAWGNIISGVTEVKRDSQKKESTMLAYAGDLETNTWKFLEFSVPHTIDTRNGPKELTSSRDTYERTMNDGSRRLRNCILSVIPGDVVESFLQECDRTMSKDPVPLADRIVNMVEAMKEIGVTKAMIEQTFGCKVEAITERQISQLRRTYQAIKDGFGAVGDYFKVSAKEGKAAELNNVVKGGQKTFADVEYPAELK